MGESWIDSNIRDIQDPQVCDSVDLYSHAESGSSKINSPNLESFLPHVVVPDVIFNPVGQVRDTRQRRTEYKSIFWSFVAPRQSIDNIFIVGSEKIRGQPNWGSLREFIDSIRHVSDGEQQSDVFVQDHMIRNK